MQTNQTYQRKNYEINFGIVKLWIKYLCQNFLMCKIFWCVNFFYVFSLVNWIHLITVIIGGSWQNLNKSPVWTWWCYPNRFSTQESTPLVVSELYVPGQSSKCDSSRIRQGRVTVLFTGLLTVTQMFLLSYSKNMPSLKKFYRTVLILPICLYENSRKSP
jgi:hypothetical protein